MMILIDVDGTIARGNTAHFLKLCNRHFKLGIGDERLEVLSRDAFLALPEVVACKAERGARQFEAAMTWLRFTKPALLSMEPIKNAQAGVEQLSQLGQIAYYTARQASYSGQDQRRRETIQKLNTRMAEATSQWLAQHAFPCSEHVVCCDGPRGKLVKIAQLVEETGTPALLVDDLSAELLSAELDEPTRSILRDSLTLVAFRTSSASGNAWLSTIALPAWSHIDDVLNVLKEQEVPDDIRSREAYQGIATL